MVARVIAMAALAVAGLFYSLSMAAAGNGDTSPPSAVVDTFHAALKAGDAARAASLLADDVVIYEEGEAELGKPEYLRSHLAADIAFSAVVVETVVARTVRDGADFAWVATQGRVRGDYRGRAVDRATTETMVLRRNAEGWRIVHIHWSSKAAAPQNN